LPWRELEHPADLRLEIEAETLEKLVAECAKAFYSAASGEELGNISGGGFGEIDVRSSEGDLGGLLVVWMNELLYRLETAREIFLPETVEVDLKTGCLVSKGKWAPAPRPGSRVKAVTYGGLEVDVGPPWRLRVILDV
jgi:SHS2 domain-containing protein